MRIAKLVSVCGAIGLLVAIIAGARHPSAQPGWYAPAVFVCVIAVLVAPLVGWRVRRLASRQAAREAGHYTGGFDQWGLVVDVARGGTLCWLAFDSCNGGFTVGKFVAATLIYLSLYFFVMD